MVQVEGMTEEQLGGLQPGQTIVVRLVMLVKIVQFKLMSNCSFLAVHNSSLGDLVTDSLTHSLTD